VPGKVYPLLQALAGQCNRPVEFLTISKTICFLNLEIHKVILTEGSLKKMDMLKQKKGMVTGGGALAVDLAVGAILLGILAIAVGYNVIFTTINDTITDQTSLDYTVAQYIPTVLLVVVLVAFVAYLYGRR
jgi:hypothetical protein